MAITHDKYFNSNTIQMYPSAYRDDNDAQSSLNTEYNLTHTKQLSEVKDLNSYVITRTEEGEDYYIVYIQGYFFKFKTSEINTTDFTGNNIYGYITLEVGVNGQGNNELKLSRLSNIKDDTTVLLDVDDSGTMKFGGLRLFDEYGSEEDKPENTKLLFTRKEVIVEGQTTYIYEIAEEARYKLTTDEVRDYDGSNYSPISKKLTTIDVETTNLNGRDVEEIFVEGSTEVNQAVLADTVTTTEDTTNELSILGVDSNDTNVIKRDTSIKVEGNTLKSVNLNENSTLNDRNIENIFESGSNDVKNATNVTTSIANNNLTDIFEEDSDDDITTIVKEATKATNDGNDNNISETYATKTELDTETVRIDNILDGTSVVKKAEQLNTARTINGTSFDGSSNITTSNWGTAREIKIASSNGSGEGTGVSVNGNEDVTLKLPSTITADITGNVTGNSDTTNKLKTSVNLQVDLNKSSSVSFDGSSGVDIGVKNTLNIPNGGTGNTQGKATLCETTVDTGSSLYLVGVKSTSPTKLMRDTSIQIKGNTITATSFNGTATKATGDKNGKDITTTYLKLDGTNNIEKLTFTNSNNSYIYAANNPSTNYIELNAKSSSNFSLGLRLETDKTATASSFNGKSRLVPILSKSVDLGSSSFKFRNIYTQNINVDDITINKGLKIGTFTYKTEVVAGTEYSIKSSISDFSDTQDYIVYVSFYNEAAKRWYTMPEIYTRGYDSSFATNNYGTSLMPYIYNISQSINDQSLRICYCDINRTSDDIKIKFAWLKSEGNTGMLNSMMWWKDDNDSFQNMSIKFKVIKC